MMRRFLWVSVFGLLFLVTLGNFAFYEYRLRNAFNETRERLILIAANAALCIDADELLKVPLEQSGEGTPEYQAISQKLIKVKQANPSLKYVYTMTATNQPGILQYLVDADPVPQIITARCPTALPGDKYDARGLPEMISAYDGPTADKKVTYDVWGAFISGYAPIRDSLGKTVAILGVDTDAAWVSVMQKKAMARGLLALFTGFLFLISLGALIFRF